jgi:ribosome-binding protein aMBF1 (putative translation factor)
MQDWETVILRKRDGQKSQKTVQKQQPKSTICSTTNRPAWAIEKQVDSDVGKPLNLIEADEAALIKRLREQKKYTQDELNIKLNLPKKTIQGIESKTACQNKELLARIKRFLQNAPINNRST